MSDDEVQRKTPEEHLADARSAVPPVGDMTRSPWGIGHRGWYLIVVGVMYMTMAYPLMETTVPHDIKEQYGLPVDIALAMGFPSVDAALDFWGVLWIVAGSLAVLGGCWPGQKDVWGFYSLWTFSAVWGTLNLYGGVVLDHDRSARIGLMFLLVAASILLVSGMTEPPSYYHRESRRHRRGSGE